MLVRPPVTNFKMTISSDSALSAHIPLPQPIKALAHWLWGGGGPGAHRAAQGVPAPWLVSSGAAHLGSGVCLQEPQLLDNLSSRDALR